MRIPIKALVIVGLLAVSLSACATEPVSLSQTTTTPVFTDPVAEPSPQVTLPATLGDLRARASRFISVALPAAGVAAQPDITPTPSATSDKPAKKKKKKKAKPRIGRERTAAKPKAKPTPSPTPTAVPQVVDTLSDVLAGPAILVSLGGQTQQVHTTHDRLPVTSLQWRGCPECDPVSLAKVFERFAADLQDDASRIGVIRQVGPDGGTVDPRGDVLSSLPALVVYSEDLRYQRWRTWYLVFDADAERVMALIGETGRL